MSWTQADRLCQAFVETQGHRHGPAYLGHVDGVGESGDHVVTGRVGEHLRLVAQPAERLGEEEPVPGRPGTASATRGPVLFRIVPGNRPSGWRWEREQIRPALDLDGPVCGAQVGPGRMVMLRPPVVATLGDIF